MRKTVLSLIITLLYISILAMFVLQVEAQGIKMVQNGFGSYAVDSVLEDPGPSATAVSCSPNPVEVGFPVTCNATVVGSSPTGNVTWSTSSSTGSFSVNPSALVEGACLTTYSDNFTGFETITASYSGDENNLPSSGITVLTVFMNIGTGANVTVHPTDNLELMFANVTVAGFTVVNLVPVVPAPFLNNTVGPYCDVGVTAEFSENVTVGLAFVGFNMTEEQKSNLRMVQYSPIPGDVREPFGLVDMRDIGFIARQFGTTPTSPNWDPVADITGPQFLVPDGVVDMRDVGLTARNFMDSSVWMDITSHVDTTNNIVYGNTNHFSFIGIH
jgi:hypothetical protein